jgi:hypothetical protein
MSNTKGTLAATNLAEIQRVMGSKYGENAMQPASVNQVYFLGDLYGKVWLASQEVDEKFHWQAKKIFGSIIRNYTADKRRNPVTKYDVSLAVEQAKNGTLVIPQQYLDMVTVDAKTFTAKAKKVKAVKAVKAEPVDTNALDNTNKRIDDMESKLGAILALLQPEEPKKASKPAKK